MFPSKNLKVSLIFSAHNLKNKMVSLPVTVIISTTISNIIRKFSSLNEYNFIFSYVTKMNWNKSWIIAVPPNACLCGSLNRKSVKVGLNQLMHCSHSEIMNNCLQRLKLCISWVKLQYLSVNYIAFIAEFLFYLFYKLNKNHMRLPVRLQKVTLIK